MAPTDVADEEALRDVIGHVHQIGWQLRLGEHIEGKRQDQQERGIPPMDPEPLERLNRVLRERGLTESSGEGIPGEPLKNPIYRFNASGEDRSAFRSLGRPGHEAETRELLRMKEDLDRQEDESG